MLTWLAKEPFWVGLWGCFYNVCISKLHDDILWWRPRTEQKCEGRSNCSTVTIVYLRHQHLCLSALQTWNGPYPQLSGLSLYLLGLSLQTIDCETSQLPVM